MESRWIMRPSQRAMQISLGVVWLIDGLLQFQPYMFTKDFASDVLAGAGQGQPSFVAHSVTAMAQFLTPHIALWNAIFASIQVLIGVGLLVPRAVKATLAASFTWVVLVWWFGEAFGQILNGGSTLINGAPGAVLLYGLIGLLVWPKAKREEGSAAAGGPLGDFGGRVIWAVVWLFDAFLQLLPANYAGGAISSALHSAASGEPGVLAGVSRGVGNAVSGHGAAVAIGLGILEAVIGLGVFIRRPNVILVLGALLALGVWIVGQDLGGILTGQGTDPNSGLLYIMLALTCWRWPIRVDVVDSVVQEPPHRYTERLVPRI